LAPEKSSEVTGTDLSPPSGKEKKKKEKKKLSTGTDLSSSSGKEKRRRKECVLYRMCSL